MVSQITREYSRLVDRSPGRQARCGEYGHGEDQRVAADHDEVAVREVYQSETGEHICHRLGNNHAIIAPNAAQCPNDKTVDHALTLGC